MQNHSQQFGSIHKAEDNVHPVCCSCWKLWEREQSSISCLFPFILFQMASSRPVIFSSSLLFNFLSSFYLLSFWFLSGSHLKKILKCPSTSCFLYQLVYRVLRRWLADNSASRRLHHVRLTGERPWTQNPHAPLVPCNPTVLFHPSMHSVRR